MREVFLDLKLLVFFFFFGGVSVSAQSILISIPQQGPDTKLLKNNYQVWEKTLPFTGLSIGFNSNSVNVGTSTGYYGKEVNELGAAVFRRTGQIRYNQYTNAINDLKGTAFKKLKFNFITIPLFDVNWSQWEDDASWNQMLSNLAVASKVAKDSGLSGIILDTETYGSPQNLNLTFYCQQFGNKIYVLGEKSGYVRIKDSRDKQTLEDLFPRPNQTIFWKDKNDVANGIKLTKVYFDVYKDAENNFYYQLLDPKYKNDISLIVEKVQQRGREIVNTVAKSFPNAEIFITVGPSYIKEVLSNLNGLNSANNVLRTGYGLLIPFMSGMLVGVEGTKLRLIDGQEQTYYHKTANQFKKSEANFVTAASYFKGNLKSKYLSKMDRAIGLYIHPTSGKSASAARTYSKNEVSDTFGYISKQKNIRYIWLYEEKESYWFIDSLKDRYLHNKKEMSKIGGVNFSDHINSIKIGVK